MLRICDWVLSHRRLTASTQHNAGALVLNELAEARASLLTDTMTDRLKADGLFDEIVSWKLRLFAPSMRPAPAFWRSSWSAIRSCASPSGRLREASTSAPWRWRALSASSSQPRKRSHRTAWLPKRGLPFGDADRSHRLPLAPACGHGLDLRQVP